MTNLLNYHESDVDRDLAQRSHSGTSWTPEKRADQEVQSYLNAMSAVAAEFEQWVTDENRDEMTADLERYRFGYVVKLHAYWQAHSRVMSTMITGPANFPVHSNQKRNDTADRRAREWLDWNAKTLKRLRRKYNPRLIARRPIRSGDDGAVEALQAKIDEAEQQQALMKTANRIARHKKLTNDQKVEQLATLDGISTSHAHLLLTPDWGKPGFTYELKNNGSNIRRMKKRIVTIQEEQERRETTLNEYEICGITVVENSGENRLQICFDGKPPADVRTALKARGFRWSPSEVAWQRQLTSNARFAAREVIMQFYKKEV